MVDKKLSEIDEVDSIKELDDFYLVQGSASKRVKYNTLGLGRTEWMMQALDHSSTPSAFGTNTTSYTTGSSSTSAIAAAPTLLHQMFPKLVLSSSAAINSSGSIILNRGLPGVRGHDSVANIGGFKWWSRMVFTACSNAQGRYFMGAVSSTSVLTATVDPSAQSQALFGLGKDATDTNLQFIRKPAAGAAAKTDLGITMASLQDKLLDFYVIATMNGPLKYVLKVVDTNTVYTDSEADGTAFIPLRSSILYFHLLSNTGSTQTTLQSVGLITGKGISYTS